MKKMGLFAVLLSVLFMGPGSAAAATVTVFSCTASTGSSTNNSTAMAAKTDQRTAWLNALGISTPDTLIDFESGFSTGSILGDTLSGGLTITSSQGYAYVATPEDNSTILGSTKNDPIGDSALAVQDSTNYTFDFSSPITYFAFYLMDHNPSPIAITFNDGTEYDVAVTVPTPDATGWGSTFFAFISDTPISSFTLTITGGDGKAGIDNIEFGAVPVPSAGILLGAGIAAIALVSRKS